MGLAGIDHAFELGVGQHAVRDDIGGQVRPIAWLGRRHRRHRRRLHQLGGVSLRAGNTDRLQSVSFIERLGDVAALDRHPVDGLIGQLNRLRLGRRGRDGGRARRNALRPCGARDEPWARGSDLAWRAGASAERRRDPAKQGCGIGGACRRSRKHRRIGGGQDGRSRSGGCRWSCHAWHRRCHRWRPRTRCARAPASRTKASGHTGLSGAQLAPVIATSRPPSARRASAEATWRRAASAMRRSTFASAENGGFMSTTLGTTPASR